MCLVLFVFLFLLFFISIYLFIYLFIFADFKHANGGWNILLP